MSKVQLNVPLILETPERVADGIGGYRLVWRPLGQLWAGMRAGAGGERFAEVGAKSVVTWRITVRAALAGDPRRPRAEQRLRMGTRLFRIASVAEEGAGGRYLTCIATEEAMA